MEKVLALVVTAAMDLSSVAFAAETAATPAPTATITKAAPVKTIHHKKQYKAVPAQKVQAAKKHHGSTRVEQEAPKQKAQVAKEHTGKHNHQQSVKLATQPAA